MKRKRLVEATAAVVCWLVADVFGGLASDGPPTDNQESRLDDRGGSVLRIPDFDLRKLGTKFNPDSSYTATYEKDAGGTGCYRIAANGAANQAKKFNSWLVEGQSTLPLKPNRSYVISALLEVDFERSSNVDTAPGVQNTRVAEVNLGLWTIDGGGSRIQAHLNGIFNKTGGKWRRWEWEFATDPRVSHGQFQIRFYNFPSNCAFKIADVAFLELPEKPLQPFARGEGARFRGGPGSLPMKIKNARVEQDKVLVETTGASYTFDTSQDTITCRQMVETARDIAVWKSTLSLKDLKILGKTDVECLLGNDKVTFGVQCDSLLVVVPHREMVLRVRSAIAGRWNRLASGHLIVIDDFGGFTANPDIPAGSGRLARVDAGTEPGRVARGALDFTDKFDDQTFLSQAAPGWELKYLLSPGERLGISIFPPRPFPWKESFRSAFTIGNRDTPVEKYSEWGKYAGIIILWDFTWRGWAMSYGKGFFREVRGVFY